MTVSTATNKVSYAGDDESTVFPYEFKTFNDSDLVVIKSDNDTLEETTLALDSDYSVTGAGDAGGGNVVLAAALDAGYTLVIRREVPLTQPTEWPASGPFPASSHEAAADRAVMMAQQIYERQSRTPVLPATATVVPLLPIPAAGKVLIGRADGQGWEGAQLSWDGDTYLVFRGEAVAAPSPGDTYLYINTSATPPALELRDGAGTLINTIIGDRTRRALPGLLADPVSAESARTDSDLGAARFANSGALGWGHFEAWLDGVAWRVQLEAMMSTGEAANVGLTLWYQVFGPDAPVILVKRRWQASTAVALGDKRIPTSPNGSYYQCTTAGTSGAAEPTWPASGTVSDGTVVWTRMGPGMIALATLSLTPPATAYDRFDLDSASLKIPVGAAAVGDRVHFALMRSASDAHSGDLLVNELWLAPVEV